ncbi:FtsX-like permease family protein [Micromonosporaceae bacterium Da 78-11]
MRRRPALLPHWPSVRGRARADAGPLLLTAVVVALISLLAGSVPVLLRDTADDAVRQAVQQAGSAGDVVASARWEDDADPDGGRDRRPYLAEDVDALRERAVSQLRDTLLGVLRPPVAVALGPTTLYISDGSLRSVRLAYLASDDGPNVTWVDGAAPGPSVPASRADVRVPDFGPPWPVHIGISESTAAALDIGPGDRIPLADEHADQKNVVVSGIFRPLDRADPAWQSAPWLLDPVAGSDRAGTLRFGGLLSAESLPDARLAFGFEELPRTVRFAPDPERLTWDTAEAIATSAAQLEATSASSADEGTGSAWNTRLDTVLRDARGQVHAATAQASVLLIAVLTGAVLVLLLAADLLVRRRTMALVVARRRGAGLPALGVELLLESVLVAVLSAAAGLALAAVLLPPATVPSVFGSGLPVASLFWALPVVLAAAGAGPVFGLLTAARATRDKRVPANRTARRWVARTAQMRRAAVELAVLATATFAFVALWQRGVAAGGDVALPAAAPALGALVGALLLLRLLPLALDQVLRQALRSNRPLAVFGAARAVESAGRALPLLALVAATALAAFALMTGATVRAGLTDGAWRTVGADARLDTAGVFTDAAVARLAAEPGVEHAVAAEVADDARVATDDVTVAPLLVVVDAAAFQRLLAETPLPAAPDLARLVTSGSTPATSGPSAPASPGAVGSPGTAVPALVRSADGSLRPGQGLELTRDGAPAVVLTAVGIAPSVAGAEDVVLVDAGALAAAGLPAAPNTVWLTGPGAGSAAGRATGSVSPPPDAAVAAADVVLRSEVLHARQDTPLVAGVVRLAWASAAILMAFGLLAFALGAAAGAPDRWQTLTRLRTLGLRPKQARRVGAGELLPLAVVAALGGPALGVLLAASTLGPLALRMLTGQIDDPTVAVPWGWLATLAVLLFAAVAVVVPVESALRRRQQLAEVLRVGG